MCLSVVTTFSQNARFDGVANTSVTLYDVWSTLSNQAGLAGVQNPTIAVGYSNRFLLSQTSTQMLTATMPTRTGNFSLAFKRFGYSLYSENNFGLAYSRSLGKYIDAGVQFDYLHYIQSEDYGNKGAILFQLGVIAKPIDRLFIGLHVYNPMKAKLSKSADERVPTIMRLGVGYYFSEQVVVTAETEKNLDLPARFKTGIEYQPVSKLFVRTGFCTQPTQFSFGAGYSLKKLTVDMAILTHQYLPLSSSISVKYMF